MSVSEERCKGCSASVRIGAESLRRMAESFKASNPGPFALETDYEARLAVCLACGDMEYGSTCRHCGCLVHLRALKASAGCPRPEGALWGPCPSTTG